MSITETGPDGAEINPFNRMIRYPAISRALPPPICDELRRIGGECAKCRKKIQNGDKSDEVKSLHSSWARKLDDLLKKLRAEHSTPVERPFVGGVGAGMTKK